MFAIFGAPVADRDHVSSVVKVAVRLQEEVGRLDDALRGDGLEALRFVIGVNAGEVIAAHAGSSWRRRYTVIGDAARSQRWSTRRNPWSRHSSRCSASSCRPASTNPRSRGCSLRRHEWFPRTPAAVQCRVDALLALPDGEFDKLLDGDPSTLTALLRTFDSCRRDNVPRTTVPRWLV